MTIEELIKTLSELPPQTKVLIRGELGLYDLSKDDIEYRNMFIVWHSDYNNNGVPFTDYSYEPESGVYVQGNGSPDYVYKKNNRGRICSIVRVTRLYTLTNLAGG